MGGSSKKQVVAYKYYEDQHIVLALSNFDHISHIWFANKLAWIGIASGETDGWGQIYINKPGLFGGEKREGGVSGRVYIGMGWPDQPRLSRLVSRLGNALMPAYRGVVSLFFDDFYFGNNPYIKELKVRAQSIHKLSDGTPQWYDSKAEILNWDELAIIATYDKDLDAESPETAFDTEGGTAVPIPPPVGSLFISVSDPSYKLRVTQPQGRAYQGWDAWTTGDKWINTVTVVKDNSQVVSVGVPNPVTGSYYNTPEEARAAFGEQVLTGATEYAMFISDTPTLDNNGGLSLHVEVEGFTSTGDINPIHLIRECHTDTIWGGRYPQSKMGDSYISAADTIYEEGLGVSFIFTEEIKWREIIEEVARHIDAIPYQDPDTGLMEIKLIRDDYDIETIPVLDPTNSDLERINDPFDNEIFNSVIIEFWNRETGEKDALTLSDPAAVDMVGYINSKTFNYSGLTNKRTAKMVGERDLARVSRPFYQGRVKINRTVANLKPGDVFLLKSPEDGIEQIVCRVTKRNESGLLNGDITIEFGEDIFGQVFTTFGQPSESVWIDPIGDPKPFPYETAFELPYYFVVQDQGETATSELSSDACFYGFAGAQPASGGHLDYDLYVYPDGTTQEPDPEFSITSAFTPIAITTAPVDRGEFTIFVESLQGMDSVRVGQLIMVGDSDDDQREFLAVDAEVANGETQLTVKRGLIDTTPKDIPVGTTLYFVETFYGGSESEYIPGETVEGYGSPSNGQGNYSGPFTYHDLLMVGRFNKPYPPANLTINSLSFPGDWYVPASNQVVFNWFHRDRVLQSDQVIDWFDATDYGPESLTTYLFEADAYDFNGDLILANWISTNIGLVKTHTLDLDVDAPPAGTATIIVRLWTIRDTEQSLQPASYCFLVPGNELLADEYTGEPVLDIDGNYILMEQSQ